MSTKGVYALVDPRDHKAHYVGASVDIQARFDALLAGFRWQTGEPCECWRDELRAAGVQPILVMLDTRPDREHFWIWRLLRAGHPLTNERPGNGSTSKQRQAWWGAKPPKPWWRGIHREWKRPERQASLPLE